MLSDLVMIKNKIIKIFSKTMNEENSKKINSEENNSSELKETNATFDSILTTLKEFVIIVIIVFAIRSFIITPFQISGTSMENNYHDKEIILVDIFSYLNFSTHFDEILENNSNFLVRTIFGALEKLPIHIWDPDRWDVVVIKPHVDIQREYYLKRIIWLPWETIKIENWKVFIKKVNSENFVELNETYLSTTNNWHTYLPYWITETEFIIPEWTYWVMWDNRLVSADSRWCFKNNCIDKNSTHFLKRADIVGKILINLGYFNIFKENSGIIPSLWELKWIHSPRFFNTPKTADYPELE